MNFCYGSTWVLSKISLNPHSYALERNTFPRSLVQSTSHGTFRSKWDTKRPWKQRSPWDSPPRRPRRRQIGRKSRARPFSRLSWWWTSGLDCRNKCLLRFVVHSGLCELIRVCDFLNRLLENLSSNEHEVSSRLTMKRVCLKPQVPRRYRGLDLYNLSVCLWGFFLGDHFLIDMEQRYGFPHTARYF